MKLKVIGSGSKGNGYVLTNERESLLLEIGVPFKEIKKSLGYNFFSIQGCLISHQHKDHCSNVRELTSTGVPIYSNDETQEFIDKVYNERIIGVQANKNINVGKFQAAPFYLPHDDVPNFGYLLEHEEMGRLLFMTDYEYCPFVFKDFGIDHMLIECNYIDKYIDRTSAKYKHVLRGHAGLDVVLDFIKANQTNNLQNIILCHLSDGSSNENEILQAVKEIVGPAVNVFIAKKNLEVKVNKYPF